MDTFSKSDPCKFIIEIFHILCYIYFLFITSETAFTRCWHILKTVKKCDK